MGKKKNKKQISPTIILGIIVVLAVLTTYALNKSQKGEVNQTNTISPTQVPTTPAEYDEETRIVTSPILQELGGSRLFSLKIHVPDNWSIEKNETAKNRLSVTLEKNDHKLDINSPKFSNSTCIFPDQSKPEDGPFEDFDTYRLLKTDFGELRLGRNTIGHNSKALQVIFRTCHWSSITNEWETGSLAGDIIFRVPTNYDRDIVNEMENIVTNIQYTIQ